MGLRGFAKTPMVRGPSTVVPMVLLSVVPMAVLPSAGTR